MRGIKGQASPEFILLAGVLLVAIVGVYAATNGDFFSEKGDTDKDIDPVTGKQAMCPNIPTLGKERQDYFVYPTGVIDISGFVGTPDVTVSRTKLSQDSLGIALISREVKVTCMVYLVGDTGVSDTGFEGDVYRTTNKDYVCEIPNVPSNWNCENYDSSESYRPQGARYLMKLVYNDIGKTPAEEIATYQEVIYVKYGS